MLIEGLVQLYYLKRNKATYSEYFFGFRRSIIDSKTQMVKPMGNWHVTLVLLFEVAVPYLK